MKLQLYYNECLTPYLNYIKNAQGTKKELVFKGKKKGWELKHLNKYIKYGITKTEFGVYFMYNLKQVKKMAEYSNITEQEWYGNQIKLFEKDFKSKRHFYRTAFLFLNLCLKEFEKSKINDKVIFMLSFSHLDFLDNKSPFYTDDFINELDFRMYCQRDNEEIFDYKNFISSKNLLSATLCIVAEN